MGRPREHGPQTRSALMTEAGRLLAAEGPSGLSIRRLADETGTTTRAVYSLFGDKSGLLRALFREAAEVMRRHHEAVPVRADPVEEVVDLAMAYRSAAREEANLYDLYLGRSIPQLAPTPDDLAVAFRSMDRVVDALRRCAETGRLADHPPEEVAVQLWALVHGLAGLELSGFLGDTQRAVGHWQAAVRAALAGYAQTDSAADPAGSTSRGRGGG